MATIRIMNGGPTAEIEEGEQPVSEIKKALGFEGAKIDLYLSADGSGVRFKKVNSEALEIKGGEIFMVQAAKK